MSFKQVHLVINPASGQPEPVLHHINAVLYDADVDWQVSVTTARHDATELTRQAVEAGADLVVAYGGDGTVKSVLNGLIDTDVPLALLHGGTGNAMAHELKIPAALRQAMELIVGDHRLRPIDVGKITCDVNPDETGHFILRSSIGLQNHLLEQATPELKERFGNLAYIAAGLRSLTNQQKAIFRLKVDGESVEVEGMTCIVANSASVGGEMSFVFAPDVAPDDGELDVFVLNSGLDSLVKMINSSFGANLDDYPNHWRGKEIRVEMDEDNDVTIDGEPFGSTPMTATVVPQAVRVLVPA